MSYKKELYKKQAATLIQNLQKRNIEGIYCESKEQAVEKALKIMGEDASVSWGGSTTLHECGLMEKLHESGLTLIDRDKAPTREEKIEKELEAFSCNYYLMSTNAITMDGQLINIDGYGNRVAALIYGSDHVLILAGMNKIVLDVDAGMDRAQNIAASANALRLDAKTPCGATGVCGDCMSAETLCCQIVITRRSRIAGRIKVILIGEELGY